MPFRRIILFAIMTLLMTPLFAKEHLTPQNLIARSDALYYTPSAHGITDLAVDIVIDQLSNDPVGKNSAITYYYAGDNQERVAIANIPDTQSAYRDKLIALVSPFSQYLMPRPASVTFAGMTLSMTKVTRVLPGVKGTTFYQIIGRSATPKDGVKEYRVLLDKGGALYQIENVLADESLIVASVENKHTDAGWHVVSLSTRLKPKNQSFIWQTVKITYGSVNGYVLPVGLTVTYRDEVNHPVKGYNDLAASFTNYRINIGIAHATLRMTADKQ
ncbi:MAG TPA: hypothetical protein VHV83_17865 [Armatimonadota bacterium]|nr:hypothetical protein [Armatimonadota bacterium]